MNGWLPSVTTRVQSDINHIEVGLQERLMTGEW